MSGQLSVAPGSETNSGFGKNQIGLNKKLKSTWFQELQPVSRSLIRRKFMRSCLGDDVYWWYLSREEGAVLSLHLCHPYFTQVPWSCLPRYTKAAGNVSSCYIRMQLNETPDPFTPIPVVTQLRWSCHTRCQVWPDDVHEQFNGNAERKWWDSMRSLMQIPTRRVSDIKPR